MSYGDWIHVLAACATMILLIVAGIGDIRRYRIPNNLVYAVVAAFAVGALFDMSWTTIGFAVLSSVAMFALTAGLFALGLFGGGDVKLIAAMALWTGLADLPRFLLVMTAAGGLLGVAWMVRRRLHRPALASEPAVAAEGLDAGTPSSGGAPARKIPNRIPYGVAIAIAGFDFFIASAHSPLVPLWHWLQ
jgi:prepilin peptidase CpaA